MEKKKVLFVIPYMHEGGAQRALSNIQERLSAFYEIDTLVNSEVNRAYPNYGNVISLHIDKKAKTGSVIFQAYAYIKRSIRLKNLKENGNYHACISFMDSANIANILTGRKKCKTIVSIRTSYSSRNDLPQYKYIVKPLARLFYNKADRIVSVSEELQKELESDIKIDPDRIVTIVNGYDVRAIRKKSEEEVPQKLNKLFKNSKIIFTAGRLSKQKQQWHLIRVFARVLYEEPDAMLVLAGTGELESYLKKLCIELGIQDRVIFTGFEKNVFRYMRIADVFVLCSGFEGFPNALGEAICVGAPCIVTDFKTGAREIVAPEILFSDQAINNVAKCCYGLLSPVCSGIMYSGNAPLEDAEKELQKAILLMLSDEEINKYYREKSTERAKGLDIDNVVSKWIDIIEN